MHDVLILRSCIFVIGIRLTRKKNFKRTFQRLFGRKPKRFCDQLKFLKVQIFSQFLEFELLKICPKCFNFSGKMIGIRLRSQKTKHYRRYLDEILYCGKTDGSG